MSSDPIARACWYKSTLPIALVGSVLLWASLPPLAWGWLGWVAPIPWLLLVATGRLPGRRPYLALYIAGFCFWMLALQWLRLPHPATSLGWIALSAYLAIYLPLFVGLSRVARHRIGLPLWLAAPTVWTGLEFARAHLLTGFLMGSLAHTQVQWTALIQIADLVGEYGVDFVLVLVASCITELLRMWVPALANNLDMESTAGGQSKRPPRLLVASLKLCAPAVAALGATLLYGYDRLINDAIEPGHYPGPRVALIQGNSLAEWKFDPERERQIMQEYCDLSRRAVDEAKKTGDGRALDLVVWPETMFRRPLYTFHPDYKPPEYATRTIEQVTRDGPEGLAELAKQLGTPILVGIDRAHFLPDASAQESPPPAERYNSAVLVDRDGKIIGTYDKIHRVMFGEYIPFAKSFPFLYGWTPLTGGIEAGREPAGLLLDGIYCFAPNICYETAIPHVIRRKVFALQNVRHVPDVLVNLTNDAWYWGASELDMHLACGVFRAVEARLPLVIAANGGISAWIDHFGNIRAESPRQEPDVIIADVEPSTIRSRYVEYGDWFAGSCLIACTLLIGVAWFDRRSQTPPALPASAHRNP